MKLSNKYRHDFPMANKVTYLDNAALVLKPQSVIDAGVEYYSDFSISNRTSDSKMGILISNKIEDTRKQIALLIDASVDEVIYSSGTTESLNLFAKMISDSLTTNDEILLSFYNHSSNIIPWIEIAKKNQCTIKYSKNIIDDINNKTKIVALSQVTNNINQHFDLDQIFAQAKKYGAIVVNDAAQAISHQKVSLNNSDVICFSANKMYGPTGLGVLAIRKGLLNSISPAKFGGGAVNKIDLQNNWEAKMGVKAFEPGTLNIAGIWQFHAALNYFNNIGLQNIEQYLTNLAYYAYDQLSQVPNIEIRSTRGDFIILFNIKNFNAQDIASFLGHQDIYVRAGTFCAKMIDYIEEQKSYVRVSLAIYNNQDDIDKLVNTILKGGDFLDFL